MLPTRVRWGGCQDLFRKLEGELGQPHWHSGLVIDLGQVLADAVAGTHAEGDEALHLPGQTRAVSLAAALRDQGGAAVHIVGS